MSLLMNVVIGRVLLCCCEGANFALGAFAHTI
jgi:hypothetical protein